MLLAFRHCLWSLCFWPNRRTLCSTASRQVHMADATVLQSLSMGTLSKNLPRKLGWNHELIYWISTSSVIGWLSWYKVPTDPQGLKWHLCASLHIIIDFNAAQRAEEAESLFAGDPVIIMTLKCYWGHGKAHLGVTNE